MAVALQGTRGEREAQRLAADLDKLDENTNQQAEAIRDGHRRAVEKVEKDIELSEIAKKQRIDASREDARGRMTQLRQEYRESREAAIGFTQRSLLGMAPSAAKDPARLMAWRDARDRAARLADSDQAVRALRGALEVEDTEQAEAICAFAFEKGWGRVWRAWPERAEGIDMLARLRAMAPTELFRFSGIR